MATGSGSSVGSSLLRGTIHSNSSNHNNSFSNNNQHHLNPSHHLQGVGSSQHHLVQQHQQTQQQQAGPPIQSQLSVGAAFFTPEQSPQSHRTPGSPDHMTTVMAKLWFDHNVESSLASLKKEEHEKRMRDLRKQLDHIADTNWKYSLVEKYIGQQ
ncbi:hypothetical protein SK128_001692 [Halocaridina rubra]|uniref:Uncharacterized protein n=1 Tax=Halocaridina rubra TaxID=373956 RepID=A0AAN8WB45_HALRR